MKLAVTAALGLALAGCDRDSVTGKPAHAATASESPAKAAAPPQPSSSAAEPKAPLPPPASTDGPLMLRGEAGLAPAARAQRVLHVGDSMVPLVGNYLRPLFQKDGRKYDIVSIASSATLDWAEKRRLQDAMYRYDPDLILISLGSNELFDPRPERRGPAVRQLVDDTRGRPCLWIGPPAWKKDTGFLDVLQKNLGHCRYFDSTRLKLPRMADGRHPTWGGSYRWASEVWKVLGGKEPVPTGN